MQWQHWTFIPTTRADDLPPISLFHGVRGTKTNPVEGEHQLHGFLTTEPMAL